VCGCVRIIIRIKKFIILIITIIKFCYSEHYRKRYSVHKHQ
jgi:hypothetical protein